MVVPETQVQLFCIGPLRHPSIGYRREHNKVSNLPDGANMVGVKQQQAVCLMKQMPLLAHDSITSWQRRRFPSASLQRATGGQ